MDVLREAYRRCSANAGAAGVDGITFEQVEAQGVGRWLEKLQEELLSGQYVPKPLFRVWIPKSTEASDRWASRRPARTALEHKSNLGWAEIRHPFHPLRGQRFQVLKARRIAGIDTFLLRDWDHGTFSIAREWTGRADLSPYDSLDSPRRRFDADALFELAALLEQLTKPKQKG